MEYKIELSKTATKNLDKIEKKDNYNFKILIKHLPNLKFNPARYGKALKGKLRGLFSYRVGDYRIIYSINKQERIVFVINVGHRRDIYG